MSVTRVEGSRPLEATLVTATTQHPRTTGERVSKKEPHSGEAPRATPPREEEPKVAPAESFKPYSLSFRFEKELNRVVVKVIDPETGDGQYPGGSAAGDPDRRSADRAGRANEFEDELDPD